VAERDPLAGAAVVTFALRTHDSHQMNAAVIGRTIRTSVVMTAQRSKRMSPHVLVTYATKAGSTREVADYIATVLRETGQEVDVLPLREVTSLRGYDQVVIGSAIRVGHVLPEVVKFVRQHVADLTGIPTAYFVVCATLWEDTPANRAIVRGYLDPLVFIHKPKAIGLFAGKVDRTKVEQPVRFFLKYVKEKPMSGGDWRDWDKIRAWALELVQVTA
jgi:menaquinone-dependent protoporphyrinogen oxidase